MDYRKKKLIEYLRKEFNIHNSKLLEAIASLPREKFVGPPFRNKAYEDKALPIGFGQTISRPSTVALMTELMEISGDEKVLEIGTGSGYQAAVLAFMGCKVFTIERIKELHNRSSRLFQELRLYNIIPLFADGRTGWPSEAPFDRIILTAAAEKIDDLLFAQLRDGGILVAPMQKDGKQMLHKFLRFKNEIIEQKVFEAKFVPLIEGRIL